MVENLKNIKDCYRVRYC